MPFKSLKLWKLLTILLTALLMISAEAGAQNAESSKQPASLEKEEQPPPGLAELVHMASELDQRFNSLERKIATVFDLNAAQKRYDANIEKFEKLTKRVQTQIAEENSSYQDLAELKAAIREKDKTNKNQINQIRNAIIKVENWRAEWLDEYQKWTLWENTLLKKVSISSVELTFNPIRFFRFVRLDVDCPDSWRSGTGC